jgi:hypothetical protein
MSVRRAVARPGRTEDLMDAALDYEQSDLSESQKVALRLTDAFLTYPARFPAELRGTVLEHFSPADIVELSFKLCYWGSNRASTALGMDEALDEHRLTAFHYDENGEYILHVAGD